MIPLLIVTFYVDEYLTELLSGEVYLIISNLTVGLMAAVTVLLWAGLNSSFYRQLGGNAGGSSDADGNAAPPNNAQ